MKKAISLLVAFGLSITLCACDAKDPENLLETQAPTKTVQEEPTDLPTNPSTEPPAQSLSNYPYGNMQKNVPSGNFMQYEDTVLFTHYDSKRFNLFAYDMNTETVSLFCKDATCTHKTSKCASGLVNSNLEQYDGKVYAMHFPGAVQELKNGHFENTVGGGVQHFWHANGNLYVVTQDASLLVYENGSDTSRILLEEYSGYWEVIFGNYLYFTSSGSIWRIDLDAENPQKEMLVENACGLVDGQHIYYMPDDTCYLYRCDMDGSNPELLLDRPVIPAASNFDEEYYYFRLFTNLEFRGEDSHDLYRFPKSNPEKIEKIAELPDTIGTVYTVPGYDKIFVVAYEMVDENTSIDTVYTMNKDGSDVTKLELPDV